MRKAASAAIALCAIATATIAAPRNVPPVELSAAMKAFAAAVQSKDRKAAEALSAFPLVNDVYQAPKSIPLSKFGPQFEMYRAFLPGCVSKTQLQPSKGQWQLDCDGNILWFSRKGGKWLHTRFENVNE